MNNQKDTQKTNVNIYEQSDVSDNKSLANIPVYEFANKKTEKLVTALYMVSDCMDTDDALKGKLRLLGVELLSDMYKLATLSPMDKHIHITISLTHIYEILSFIEIAYTIGFISEMNTNILKKEFSFLASDLKLSQTKDKHFTFTLDEKMFELPELQSSGGVRQGGVRQGLAQIKDNNLDKRTSFNTMSFMNKKSPLQNSEQKRTPNSTSNLADRQDRSNKIISLIKGKKDISIKDISLAFTDCSEKTVQRELNALVLKGQLKKTGAKRWSRYGIITN
ncbi:MAG: hypothetical protein WCT42_02845 [Candidatus Paceibacterota bacterium]